MLLVSAKNRLHGAQERTRTFTTLQSLAPEASASTNFTTWAMDIQEYQNFAINLEIEARFAETLFTGYVYE